ncbi:hypothetical protein CONPUDRAFT_140629 [Coniophora puteana RWD-64-598 SS2]|uniref:Uncharacterized protein n=1 Tax=Coniophora puteana (strain RWD-64-598) TaxID=741705 RepID=R7SEF3_CONPW|nr:uncharacterized protein CONPUDRAFT_140629 [Coniophora puteana RWD-64-598 SS2]EIW74127.1 hypothetical protein CONPUDRAFT_140629 [Coniophora puteana RWD-64-598 SS2]
MRYSGCVANTTRNQRQKEVAASISSCIVAQKADGVRHHAIYRSREEQEQRLVQVFMFFEQEGGIWAPNASKVHAEQLRHIRNGCPTRPRDDIASDGSRIEGSHKGRNGLNCAQPSGLETISAPCHDYVLRRNIRTASRLEDQSKFVQSTFGSHHIRFVDYIARLFNQTCQETKSDSLTCLPILPTVRSGESFGLVPSHHFLSFGGTIEVKIEDDVQFEVDSTTRMDDRMGALGGMDIDVLVPKSGPEVVQNHGIPSHHEIDIPSPCLPGTKETDVKSTHMTAATMETAITEFADKALSSSIVTDGGDSLLAPGLSLSDHTPFQLPPPLHSKFHVHHAPLALAPVEPTPPTIPEPSSPAKQKADTYDLDKVQLKRMHREMADNTSYLRKHDLDCQVFKSISSAQTPGVSRTLHGYFHSHSVHSSMVACSQLGGAKATFGLLELPPGLTRSEHSFSISTGIDARALRIEGGVEFFLFMDMRAEFKWQSYNMSSKKWVPATDLYNSRLCRFNETNQVPTIAKHPQALLRKLGEIERKVLDRIHTQNFKSKSNSETFWKHHCEAVHLIKEDPDKRSRTPATCTRCLTVMYPGGLSPTGNHKKGVCGDGVRQIRKDNEELPPWPQPQGVFTRGEHFHPAVFLKTIQQVYERTFVRSSGESEVLEAEAFANMVTSRTITVEGGHVLFKMYRAFAADACTPDSALTIFNDEKYLRIPYLEN